MSKIEWHSEQNPPSYFSHNGVKYERVFIDVKEMNGMQQVALDNNIINYCILYDKNNSVTHLNKECFSGCFYIPFLKYSTKEQLIEAINGMIDKFHKASLLEHMRVYVYRYIDANGNRFVAVGATNFKKKHDTIHALRIKTIETDIGLVDPSMAWRLIADEMGNNQKEESDFCSIEKIEVLPFEERTYPVSNEAKSVLVLHDEKSDFNGEFTIGQTNSKFHDREKRRRGSVFKLKTFRVSSMAEFNQRIHWGICCFRSLTGLLRVHAAGMYSVLPTGDLDISIIVFENRVPVPVEEEDEYSF